MARRVLEEDVNHLCKVLERYSVNVLTDGLLNCTHIEMRLTRQEETR